MEAPRKPDASAPGPAPFVEGRAPQGEGPSEGPSRTERQAALEAVLQSGSFLRAEQKRSFLRYICEMELAGRGGELSEYVIGVEALGRPPGYSTGEDSSVRRHAHDLRQRLDEVYATELSSSRVRIGLPKGRYAPRFLYWEGTPPAPSPSIEPSAAARVPPPAAAAVAPAPPAARTGHRRAFALGLAVGVAATSGVVGLWPLRASFLGRPASGAPRSIEAEGHTTTLTGLAARGECRNCSQGGRVRFVGRGNDVTFTDVEASEDGNYTMQIDYVVDGARKLSLSVNEGPPVALLLKGDSWSAPSSTVVNVALRAGRNRVRFFNEEAYGPDLDRIVLR